MQSFFQDLKVIELASVLAGPAVGMFFAELGAEVIKVENKNTGGDMTRNWKLPSEDKDAAYSAYYCSVNWNKRVLFKDLNDPSDYEEVLNLIRQADVVISNFKPSSARKLKLDYATLKKHNERLIYAELSSYGGDDESPAFDIVMQAEAGFLYMCGEPDSDPVRMPVALIDLLAAHQLKEGILLALLKRYKTGKGSWVKTSLFESAVASLANQATNWLMGNHIPQRMGSLHPNIAPYGDVFNTKDQKPIVLAVGTEKQFQLLCKVLGSEDLLADSRFATNSARIQNRPALKEALTAAISSFSREELLKSFKSAGVPAASIRNMQEVFEIPQAQAMILEEDLENGKLSKRTATIAFTVE